MKGLKVVGKIDLTNIKKTLYSGKFVPEWNGKGIGLRFDSLQLALEAAHSTDFLKGILDYYQELLYKEDFDELKELVSNYKPKIVRY